MNKVARWIIWIHWWNNDNLNHTLRLQVGRCEWVSSRIMNLATTTNHFDLVLNSKARCTMIYYTIYYMQKGTHLVTCEEFLRRDEPRTSELRFRLKSCKQTCIWCIKLNVFDESMINEVFFQIHTPFSMNYRRNITKSLFDSSLIKVIVF